MDTGSAKKKKHRRATSNLETQNGDMAGSRDHLMDDHESPKVIKARERTKARFESFLQDAVAEDSAQSAKKKKKKKRAHTTDSVLETLRSGSPIAKATSHSEEDLLQKNLYNGDKNSSNAKQSKESYQQFITESRDVPETEDVTPKKTRHRRQTSQSETIDTPEDSTKKKRRKKPKTPTRASAAAEESGKENEAFVADDTPDGPQPDVTQKPKSPNRRGERVRRRLQDGNEEDSTTRKRPDDGLIFSVTIHRADRLKPDLSILHPLVRVHMVDMDTGKYIKKSEKDRNVTSFYESESNVDYILPVMTQPFDFKKNKCLVPYWEEVLLFNEQFSYFLGKQESDPKVVILFEIVDFLSVAAAKRQSRSETDKGWYHVAWAFLKVLGANGSINTDKKVRLQLFYPGRATFRARDPNVLEVYHWWKLARRVPYPSTLYVTLKGIIPPKEVDPGLRSMYAIQQEQGRVSFNELATDAERRAHGKRDKKESTEPTNWTRLPGQVNRIPNKQFLSLRSGQRGCFVVKFSNNGRYLACACADMDSFPVIVYEIPSGDCSGELPGHFSIIYDLCWSQDDQELMSASSDGTVRIWDTKGMMTTSLKILPHPCFVYAARYHPVATQIVVTGGYDRLLRVWTKDSEGPNGQLLRELGGHSGFVNSICFDSQGTTMFSADSSGCIIIWQTYLDPATITGRKKKTAAGRGSVYSWVSLKDLREDELKGNVINSILLHPGERKLLVHTRNSALYMLDLRSYTIMQRYLGASNFKEHIHSAMSACGSFVFSGSEDGLAYVWNTDTGDIVSIYTSLAYEHAVSDVDFHPLDHLIVFCSFGNSQPVLVYKYNVKAAKEDAKRLMEPGATPVKETALETSLATPMVESLRTMGDVTHDVMRMQRVKSKLDSVLETPGTARLMDTGMLRTPGNASFQTPGINTMYQQQIQRTPETPLFQTPPKQPLQAHTGRVTFQSPDFAMRSARQGLATNASLSTWGSDFSSTYMTSYQPTPSPGQLPATGFPSTPHAQQHFGASGRFTPGYARQGSLTMSMAAPAAETPGPLRMSQLNQKPTFSFNAGAFKSKQAAQPKKQVLVMYPYEANRADELTITPGDVITVLYQDNENWWMGELADGRQGYFPSNYIMEKEELDSEADLKETQLPPAVPTNTSKHKKKDKMTAVTSKTGELRILSGPEDSSDAEMAATQRARQRRRHKKNEEVDTPTKKSTPPTKKSAPPTKKSAPPLKTTSLSRAER
ncbi:jouberin isoform X2 [Nematostella vectensis]|uniref:jouberin isoform X2 n=1 Tax=Nematostella vectensis TaxID=45351 RepID=UPI002076FB43|nr:jouberin isoform X2 [Nematostella vectensis]